MAEGNRAKQDPPSHCPAGPHRAVVDAQPMERRVIKELWVLCEGPLEGLHFQNMVLR